MNVLVFQHLDVEHPGSFRPLWQRDGIASTVVELDVGEPIPRDLTRFDALVVMGGPQDVWQEDIYSWLAPEKAAISHFVRDLGRPFLGVCLGHQLLAEAVGGSVGPMHAPEVGIVDVELTDAGKRDGLFVALSSPLTTLQWHGAEVKSLPEGAAVLAGNAHCPIQAFRYGSSAYGLQFHVEITPTTVAEWQAVPAYAAALDKALGSNGAGDFARKTAALMTDFEAVAATMHGNFLGALAARGTRVAEAASW